MLKQEDYMHHISGQFNAELEGLRNQMLVYLRDGSYKRIEIQVVCFFSHQFSLI